MLVQDKTRKCSRMNFRALIRVVAMQQFGHFMMGKARAKGRTLIVSGAYGGDGLPMSVDPDIFAMAMPVPKPLYDAWATGGGWNGAGSEAHAMQVWAQSLLRRQKKVSRRHRLGRFTPKEKAWVTCVTAVRPDGTMPVDGKPLFQVIPSSRG